MSATPFDHLRTLGRVTAARLSDADLASALAEPDLSSIGREALEAEMAARKASPQTTLPDCREETATPGQTGSSRAGSLTEFLLAQIAEDYEAAWGAEPSPWREGAWDGEFDGPREVLGRHGNVTAVCYYGGTYGHVMRFNPTRIIADCEAKRRIVGTHTRREFFRPGGSDIMCALDSDRWPCLTLRALALPYADHPDYREEWKP